MAVFVEAGSRGVAVRLVVGLAAGVALGAATGASGAPVAMEPLAAGAGGAEAGACARSLAEVVWGFVLVLLALTISHWGTFKHRAGGGLKVHLLCGVFAPFRDLRKAIFSSWICFTMAWKCYKLDDPEMRLMSFKWVRILFSLVSPLSKFPARFLGVCDIIFYLPNGAPQELKEIPKEQLETLEEANDEIISEDLESSLKSKQVSSRRSKLLDESWAWLWRSFEVKDESEAMVIGDDGARECKKGYYDKKQLNIHGKVVLLWIHLLKGDEYKFLPDYDELKFLRGNSGFATIAIAIQAIGYIYAVLFRSIKGLRVAPIEVIGLILNMILLVKASHYSTFNPCHRPLIIYMNGERERKFLSVLKSKPRSSFQFNVAFHLIITIIHILFILLCLYIPLIYFIVILKRDINIMIVLPFITFLIGLFGDYIVFCYDYRGTIIGIIFVLSILSNVFAYVWAMVVTVRYWKLEHFDARLELVNLSQIIPFIG